MASIKRKKTDAPGSNNDTGFGSNASGYGGRFVNKDGVPNIEKRGMNFLTRVSWYHTLLQLPRWKFISLLVFFYIAINFVFAAIYTKTFFLRFVMSLLSRKVTKVYV